MLKYILPVIAVLSGLAFVVLVKPEKPKNLRLLLAFSGAFLLSLTVFSLLPELYGHADADTIGVFILLGLLLQLVLEFFSKGAEHGHTPASATNGFPGLIFVSLALHALLEGFPVFHHHGLLYGIVIHKLPVAVIVSIFLLNSSIKKSYTVAFLALFSLMTPLGTLLAELFELPGTYSRRLSAVTAGIFLHVSTVILFESSEGHRFNACKFSVILIGIVLACFV